jgi:hypothetical protein
LNYVSYQAGELILFENYKKVGLIIEVNPESLKVLDDHNLLVNVNSQEISRKIIPSRN